MRIQKVLNVSKSRKQCRVNTQRQKYLQSECAINYLNNNFVAFKTRIKSKSQKFFFFSSY